MNFKSGEYGNIHIIKKESSIYIANSQKLKINKLVYATNSCTLYEDENDKLKRVISSTPIYEIKDKQNFIKELGMLSLKNVTLLLII